MISLKVERMNLKNKIEEKIWRLTVLEKFAEAEELYNKYLSEAEAYFVVKDNKYLLETVPAFIEFIESEI